MNVLIDSLGGSLATALSIVAAFRGLGNVHVHFVGMNASAATIASMGAKRITPCTSSTSVQSSSLSGLLTQNFASLISERIADTLQIPFCFDCARCRSKQRVGAVFDANNILSEPNVIVFDDFVTTGATLLAMKNLMKESHQCLSAE